jgi:hypothetical protein
METQKEGTAVSSFFVNRRTSGQADWLLPLILNPSIQSLFKKKLVKSYFLLDISAAFSYFYNNFEISDLTINKNLKTFPLYISINHQLVDPIYILFI